MNNESECFTGSKFSYIVFECLDILVRHELELFIWLLKLIDKKATTAQWKQYINRVNVHHQHIKHLKVCQKKTRLAPRISNTLSGVWYRPVIDTTRVYYISYFSSELLLIIIKLRVSFQLLKSYRQTCYRQTEEL